MRLHLLVLSCCLMCSPSIAQQPVVAVAPAAPPAAPQLVWLRGRLITADGAPVVGAALQFARTGTLSTADLLQQPQAVSDAEGRFELQVQPERRPAPVDGDIEAVAEWSPASLWVAAKGFASVRVAVVFDKRAAATQLPGFLLAGNDPAGQPPADAIEFDDLVLVPGHRLVTRVRDAAGKPLAGVQVVARDLLADGSLFGGEADPAQFHCVAVSDAAGIVNLPCALPVGGVLTFSLDGYHEQRLSPVSAATAVEVAMQKGGWIQGRVLDREGHSIAGARVSIGYELQMGAATRLVRTGPDGSFRANLEYPGRWRATAFRQRDGVIVQGHAPVLQGSRENLEILVEAGESKPTVQQPVRVVEQGSGKPIATFRLGVAWHEYANQNAGYRDYLLGSALAAGKPCHAGEGSVPAPGQHEVRSGWLRVVAQGFAPATQKVEWQEPAAGEAPAAIPVELEPEAVVRGVLRDEASGQPVADARVVARLHHESMQGFFGNEYSGVMAVATSGKDGSYELRGLGAGKWDLRALDQRRPRCPLVEVELVAGEQRAAVDMTLPAGATVAGKLVGAAAGSALRARLLRMPPPALAAGHFSHGGSDDEAHHEVPIGRDGTFRFEGVGIDNWHLVMRVSQPPRRGGALWLPIEPFRVRPAGVQRDFDCSLERPGTIRGKLTFAATDLPFDQLVVVARGVSDEGQDFFSPHDQQLPGPRSFVSPTGEFDLQVGPGSYRLLVVDLATQLPLHDDPKRVVIKSGGAAALDMRLELARIEIELKGPADGKPMAEVARVEVHLVSKAMKAQGLKVDESEDYDRGTGIRWPVGKRVHSIVLPLGDATFLCRNALQAIRVDDNRWNNAPLGRGELEIASGNGAKSRCVIEVGPPPEVTDVTEKPAGEAEVFEVPVIK